MATKFAGDWTGARSNSSAQRGLIDCLGKAMTQAMDFAVEVAVDTVETSGTDKEWGREWYGRSYSGKGRVNTGEMRDALDSKVQAEGNKVTGTFGWLEGSPFYFVFQEYGFRHWITGQLIEGMHALRTADDQAWEEFMSLSDSCIVKYKNAL